MKRCAIVIVHACNAWHGRLAEGCHWLRAATGRSVCTHSQAGRWDSWLPSHLSGLQGRRLGRDVTLPDSPHGGGLQHEVAPTLPSLAAATASWGRMGPWLVPLSAKDRVLKHPHPKTEGGTVTAGGTSPSPWSHPRSHPFKPKTGLASQRPDKKSTRQASATKTKLSPPPLPGLGRSQPRLVEPCCVPAPLSNHGDCYGGPRGCRRGHARPELVPVRGRPGQGRHRGAAVRRLLRGACHDALEGPGRQNSDSGTFGDWGGPTWPPPPGHALLASPAWDAWAQRAQSPTPCALLPYVPPPLPPRRWARWPPSVCAVTPSRAVRWATPM